MLAGIMLSRILNGPPFQVIDEVAGRELYSSANSGICDVALRDPFVQSFQMDSEHVRCFATGQEFRALVSQVSDDFVL